MKGKRSLIFMVLSAFVALGIHAQNESWLSRNLKKGMNYLDSLWEAKVDTNYIEVPKKPWRVVIYPKVNMIDVKMNHQIDLSTTAYRELDDFTDADWTMHINPPLATYLGVWVGYRGLGIGYSIPLIKNAGRYWTVSSTGTHYGLIFSLRRFKTQDMKLDANVRIGDNEMSEKAVPYKSHAPIWVRSVFLDGYYVFNGKHYSQDAAYNQSVIQRRSAGSLLLGASWYQSSIDYSDKLNGEFISAASGVGKIKVQQANIGIGYGYNWVPAKGWLFNIMVMPTVSVYNRVKVTTYDSNYSFDIVQENTENYGNWNAETHEWSNGEKKRPLPFDEQDLSWQNDVEMWETGERINKTRWKVNINGRAGITYNGKNWFANVYGQLHRFSYNHDNTSVKMWDWYVNTQFGIRF